MLRLLASTGFLLILLAASSAVHAQAPTKIYWTDGGGNPSVNKIQRANLDGSNVEDVLTGLGIPNALFIDVSGGKIYWGANGPNKIRRADLDGTNIEDLITGLGEPEGIVLNTSRSKMYWADSQADKIQRADPNGSNIEDLITTGLITPVGIALHEAAGKMYWTDLGTDKIQRADLDGTNIEDLVVGLGEPEGIALDIAGGKMYWADLTTDKIQRANLDGSNVEDLVTIGLSNPNGLSLDVAASKIYWADFGTGSIRRANLDGSNVEDLVTGLSHPNFIVLNIPDNGGISNGGAPDLRIAGKIAFTSDRDEATQEVYSMNPDGGDLLRLTQNGNNGNRMDFSPDGAKIAFSSTRTGSNQIYVMNVDGSNEVQITNGSGDNWAPKWSPDGTKINFSSNRDGDREIFTMNADGSNQVQLTDNGATDVHSHWSPDGTKISFQSDRSGISQIWIMDADGGNQVNLSNFFSSDTQPRFSPDGTKIVFDSNRDGAGQEIYVMNVDGSNPIRLTTNSLNNQQTFWSPDGTKIVFHRGTENEIYRIDADGSNLVQLTNDPALDSRPAWQQFRHIGTADLNTPVSRAMTIENPGSAGLTVSDITSDNGQFTMSPTSFTVSPNGSQDVAVTFTPTSTGTKYATLSIESNDPDSPTVSLIVNGIGQTPANAQSPTKIYWTDEGTDKIQRANLDGSNIEDLITTGLDLPHGIAIDTFNEKMYWTDFGSVKIQRANLDGTDIEDLVTAASGITTPVNIALDIPGGKMYWADGGNTDKIQRANLDGTNIEDLVTSGLIAPTGIALNVPDGKMYWADVTAKKIQRANLNGTNVEDLVTSADGLLQPVMIALDIPGGKMYWTDEDADKIQRANLDGTNVEDLVASGLIQPVGITLDLANGKMYWVDQFAKKIQRANLDGTGVEDLITTSSGLAHPNEIVLNIPDNGGISNGGAPDLQIAGKIAYYDNRDGDNDIFTINPDGTGETQVTTESTEDIHPVWSPDGTKFVFRTTDANNRDIFTMDDDGSNRINLTSNPTISEDTPTWSEDGDQIGFVTNKDGNSGQEVYVMNPDGTAQTRLTFSSGTENYPFWSPDGTKIIFESRRDGNAEIYLMDTDGSNQVNLTNNPAHDEAPHWSPDGTKITFLSERDGNREIYVMNADGSNLINLTNHSGKDEIGRWSPDGKRIVFTTDRIAQEEVYIMNADGSNPVRIANGNAPHWLPFQHIGTAELNTPVSRTMTIENPGNADLTVSDITSDNGQFTMSPTSFTVTPGSSQDVSVTFTPTSTGTRYGTLTIESNDPDSPAISVIVNGIGQTPANAQSPTKIYWAEGDPEDGTGKKVQRVNIDGSNIEDLVTSVQGLDSPFGIALDMKSGKIYWTDHTADKVQRSDLNGLNVEDLVSTGIDGPTGIALDIPGSKMYWANNNTDNIKRANLDGSGIEDLVTAADGLMQPQGIALDVPGGKMYWADPVTDKIQRANLDGSNVEDLVTQNLESPIGIAVDLLNSKIYWTDSVTDKIQRANLDGSNVEDLITGLDQPVGITLDFSAGKMYWTDHITKKIQRADIDGSNIEDVVTNLAHPDLLALNTPDNGGISNGTFPVTIAIDTTLAGPGQSAKLNLTLDNTGSVAVGGAQFHIYLGDMTKATFTGFADTLMAVNGGFTVSATVSNDTLKVVVLSGSGATLDPGVHVIGRLCFDLVDDHAHLGMEVALPIDAVEVGNENAQVLAAETQEGRLQIGIRGDVNLDGAVSILDVIKLVRLIIGAESAPTPGSTAFHIADVTGDGSLNITDVIAQVNIILGLPPASKSVSSPISATLDAPIILLDGRPAIPLTLHGSGLAGMQASLRFDPALLSLDRAIFAADQEGLLVESHIEDGIMRLTAVDLSGKGLPVETVIYIPVSMIGDKGVVTLSELIPASRQAHVLPVQLTTAAQTLSGRNTTLPASFALHGARPNPFNPSTVIAYDVPEQAHITLIVYNLLGQEVVRLVDRVQQAGRYQTIWHGVNTQGRGVSSGVYLYRLSSSTGYSESRRMTLLK